MIKAVVDANVLVSAFLNPQGPSGQILDLAASGQIIFCLDNRIVYEYREVLRRTKLNFYVQDTDDLFEFLDDKGLKVIAASLPLDFKWPDLSEAKFLEVAVAAQAHYLITGNLKHYPAHTVKRVRIISPARFLAVLKPR